MGVGQAIGHFLIRVPDHNVGIGAGKQGALARIQAEDFCRVRAVVGNELVGCNPARTHAGSPQYGQAVFDPGQSIRDFGEVIPAQLLAGDGNLVSFIDDGPRTIVKEWAVVRADRLQDTLRQALPQPGVILRRAHRR